MVSMTQINPCIRSRMLSAALGQERRLERDELASWFKRLERADEIIKCSADAQTVVLETIDAVGFSETCELRLAA